MKTIIKLSLGLLLVLIFFACTKNFDEINTNPNQPAEVTTATLLTGAMKSLSDDIYDEWWGGRQSMLYAQYWCQRNYPSEDRFAIRQNVNNQYWRQIYHSVMNLQQIIKLNTDPETAVKASASGDNANQIAVATILKVWAMQQLADTWGDIPYSEAFQADAVPTPKYDKLTDIYASFQKELADAVKLIDESKPGFTSGDVFYSGDMAKWRKFGNSLRLRVALRLSNTDNYAAAKAIANEEGIEFMTSNDDNAQFAYVGQSPNNSPLYDAWWTSARNDFTTCKTLVNMLKGVDDTLNNKVNPFHGLTDPRLQVYSRKRSGDYKGMPYGMTEGQTQAYWGKKLCPSFYGAAAYSPSTAPVILNAKYAPVFMEYSEVEFMLSEINNWDQDHYLAGVTASIDKWRDISVALEGRDASWVAAYDQLKSDYLAGVPAASKTTVMAQKYLSFYDQAYQAWAEYRRTGEPEFLLKPGEHANVNSDGSFIDFIPLVTITTIPWRMTYPQQEFTVNGANATAAASAVGVGGDQMSTKLFWQPQGK